MARQAGLGRAWQGTAGEARRGPVRHGVARQSVHGVAGAAVYDSEAVAAHLVLGCLEVTQ